MVTIALPTDSQRSMVYNSVNVALLGTVLCTQFPAVVIPHLIRAQQRGVIHISNAINKEIWPILTVYVTIVAAPASKGRVTVKRPLLLFISHLFPKFLARLYSKIMSAWRMCVDFPFPSIYFCLFYPGSWVESHGI